VCCAGNFTPLPDGLSDLAVNSYCYCELCTNSDSDDKVDPSAGDSGSPAASNRALCLSALIRKHVLNNDFLLMICSADVTFYKSILAKKLVHEDFYCCSILQEIIRIKYIA